MPFREQRALQQTLPGFVELLPLVAGEARPESAVADATALRDPLTQAVQEAVDGRREQEASQLAERLRAMIGRMLIHDGEGGKTRPLVAGDVMLLVRSRTQIAVYERALAAAGIPYAAASRGGLLESLEVRDIVALLEFLVTPAADLALAHALKSPLFACSDDDLQQIAARPEATWWLRLDALAAAHRAGSSVDHGTTSAPHGCSRSGSPWRRRCRRTICSITSTTAAKSWPVTGWRYRKRVALQHAPISKPCCCWPWMSTGALPEPASLHRRTAGAAAGGR